MLACPVCRVGGLRGTPRSTHHVGWLIDTDANPPSLCNDLLVQRLPPGETAKHCWLLRKGEGDTCRENCHDPVLQCSLVAEFLANQCISCTPPPPLYTLRQNTKLIRSLRLLKLGHGRSFHATHTTTDTHVSERIV